MIDQRDQPLDHETGLVRVCDSRCGSCVFWTDGKSIVSQERASEVIQANLKSDALLTCHSTLETDAPAVCAGFWAKHRNDVLAGRLAQLIGTSRIDPGSVNQLD